MTSAGSYVGRSTSEIQHPGRLPTDANSQGTVLGEGAPDRHSVPTIGFPRSLYLATTVSIPIHI